MYVDDTLIMVLLILTGLTLFNVCWPVVCWAMLRRKSKEHEKRINALEGRNNYTPWISIESRAPTRHAFYEVMTEEGYPRHLVTKVIHFNGTIGGIKFWRALPEGGKP